MNAVPKYPHWRPLECADKRVLDHYCRGFAPYAEATSATLIVWNYLGGCLISQLNGNVILHHQSCGGSSAITMLGPNAPAHTARTLIDGEGIALRLVPSYSLGALSVASWAAESLRVSADRDNDDYVLDTVRLAGLAGGDLKGKRKRRNAFAREHQPSDCLLDLTCAADAAAISRCAEAWFSEVGRYQAAPPEEELRGLDQLLRLSVRREIGGLLGFGVRSYGRLIAISIVETHGTDTASGVVFKASREFSGSAEYLRSSSAAKLADMGYARLNVQQDLGHPGLRQMKTAYRPVEMLRKWVLADGRDLRPC